MNNVFISYSHLDNGLFSQLVQHLKVLEKNNTFIVKSDKDIFASQDWYNHITKDINSANAVVLLISQNFLTSKFILEEEVPQIFRRKQEEGLLVFPIIAQPCAWLEIPWLSPINARPNDNKALSEFSLPKRNRVLSNFTRELSEILKENPQKIEQYAESLIYKDKQKLSLNTNIIASLKSLFEKFKPLNFINPNLLANFAPFNVLNNKVYHYDRFTLQTLNEQIIELFKNISIDKSNVLLNDVPLSKSNDIKLIDYTEDIKLIIYHLNESLIFHIEGYENVEEVKNYLKNPSVLGGSLSHELQDYDDKLLNINVKIVDEEPKSLTSLYYDLKIDKLLDKIEIIRGLPESETLDYCYATYKLKLDGFKESCKTLLKLSQSKNCSQIESFICKYNLGNLHWLMKNDLSLIDNDELIKETVNIDLDKLLFELNIADNEIYQVLKDIKDEKILNKSKDKILEIKQKIDETYELYINDGRSFGSYYPLELNQEMAMVLYNYTSNYLFFDCFSDFTKVVKDYIEALMISYATDLKYSGRLKHIDIFQIFLIIHYANGSSLNKTLEKYKIKEIEINEEAYNKLLSCFSNFFNSAISKNRYDFTRNNKFVSYIESDYWTFQEMSDILANIIFLFSKISLNGTDLNKIASDLAVLFEFYPKLFIHGNINQFDLFLKKHSQFLEISTLSKFLNLSINFYSCNR